MKGKRLIQRVKVFHCIWSRLIDKTVLGKRRSEPIGRPEHIIHGSGKIAAIGRIGAAVHPFRVAIVSIAIAFLGMCSICFSQPEANQAQQINKLIGEGKWLYREGKHKEAAEAFSEVLKLNPSLVDYYINLADAHLALGEYEQAVKDITILRKSTTSWGSKRVGLYRRAKAYRKLGKYSLAINDCNALLRNSDDPTAYGERAESYLALNDPKRALEDFERAIKYTDRELDITDILVGRALCRAKLGQTELAIIDLRAVAEKAAKADRKNLARWCRRKIGELERNAKK